MILKIKDNLHLIPRKKSIKVISYETEVAEIKEGKIHPHGKFSRTTGKQLHGLSLLLNIPLINSRSHKVPYEKLYYGANIKFDNCLSIKASVLIARELMIQGLMGASANAWSKIKLNNDRELILKHFCKAPHFTEMISLAELGITFPDEPLDLSKINI